jgi:hypothetical protein
MGCDIHAHIEIRYKPKTQTRYKPRTGAQTETEARAEVEPNEWMYYAPIDFNRDYSLFASLAGVRGEGPEPKGLPEGITPMTRLHVDHWGSNGHDHSWADEKETTAAIERYLERFQHQYFETAIRLGDLFDNPYHYFLEHRNEYPSYIVGFRMVYWFSN